MSYKLIPMVDAGDLPDKVVDWCDNNEIPTHYDSGIAMFETKSHNPLNKWLNEQGYTTTEKYTYVAVQGT